VSHSSQSFNYFDFFEDHAPPSSLELALHHTSGSGSPGPTHSDLTAETGNLNWGVLHPEFLFGKGADIFGMEVLDTTTDTNPGSDFEPTSTGNIIPTPGSPNSPPQGNEELEEARRPRTSGVGLTVRDNGKKRLMTFPHANFRNPNPYETINLHENGPEMLMLRFDKEVCGVLSIMDGPTENPWRKFVWPLAPDSPAVYHAIAALTAFHASREKPSFRVDGMEHMRRSIRSLASNLEKMPSTTALATALLLSFAESWDQHVSTGSYHLRGTLCLVDKLRENHELHDDEIQNINLLNFLLNTWCYRAVLAEIAAPWHFPELSVLQQLRNHLEVNLEPDISQEVELNPLMGAARTLFPLIHLVAAVCIMAWNTSSNSITIICYARVLRERIDRWKPGGSFQPPEDPNSAVSDALETAEAYRYATLLHLHQAFPEIPSLSSALLSKKTLIRLSNVPIYSSVIVVQIYPLLAAGCEAYTKEDRDWVVDRWKAMANRMKIGSIDRCLEITKEVWTRRDAFLKTKNTVAVYTATPGVKDETLKIEALEPEMTVRGKLHWLSVMKDWNWEVDL